jgi:hypothetical protein
MRVIGTRINLQLLDHLISEFVLGQHSTNGVIDQILGFSVTAVGVAFKSESGVSRIPRVVSVVHFLAGHPDFLGIENDDEITAVDMGCVLRSMLSHQDHSNVACQPSEDLVGRVDDVPLLFYLARLGHECWLSDHELNLPFDWFRIGNGSPRKLWGIEEFIGGRLTGQGLSRQITANIGASIGKLEAFAAKSEGFRGL